MNRFLFACSIAACTGTAFAQSFTVTNGIVAAQFAQTGPGGSPQIQQVSDLSNPAAPPFTFQTGISAADLWRLELLDKANSQLGTPLLMEPSNATMTGVTVIPNLPTASTYLIWWQGVRLAAQPAGESVDLVAILNAAPGDSVVTMELIVQPTSTTPMVSHSLFAVEFPRMVVNQRSTDDETLSMPVVGGWLVDSPSTNAAFAGAAGAEGMISYPGYLSMQWFSYYGSTPGSMFFGTRDPAGYRKEFIVKPTTAGPSGLQNSQRHVLANSTTVTSFSSPYPYVLGTVGNDWYDGARFYRDWATQQAFVPPTMDANPSFSSTLRDAAVFGTFSVPPCSQFPQCPPVPNAIKFDHSNFQYWKRDVDDQVAAFNAGDIPAFIYNWEESAFDSVWGEWLPVRPQFVGEAAQLAAANQPFAPYFFTTTYSTAAPFSGLFDTAVVLSRNQQAVQDNGQVPRRAGDCSVPLTFPTQSNRRICYAEAITQQYPRDYAGLLAGAYGATGIYLDVFTNDRHVECYDSNHNHPVGGGNWNVQARQSLVSQLRASVRSNHDPAFYTYSESQSEMFLSQFELVFEHITGETAAGLPVTRAPLFETVYHDRQLTSNVLGVSLPAAHCLNSAGVHDYARWFYSNRTYFGGTPFAGSLLSPTTLATNRVQASFDRFMAMAVNYVDVLKRDSVRDMVTFGDRRRDPVTTAAIANVPLAAINSYSTSQPTVLASAWSRPSMDRAGVLLQNWTHTADQPTIPGGNQTINVTIDTVNLGLDPTAAYDINIVESNVAVPLNTGPVVLGTSYTFPINVSQTTAKFVFFTK